jgi:hypothetical protein
MEASLTRDQAQKLIDLFQQRDDINHKLEQFERWGGDIIIYSRYEDDREILDFSDNKPIIKEILKQAIDEINKKIKDAGGSP